MEGAISFCGTMAEKALAESCRVTRGTLLVAVSHRAQMIPICVSGSLVELGCLAPAVEAMVARGEWSQDTFPENPVLTRGLTQDHMGVFRAFLPGELRELLVSEGMEVLRCGGLGTLAGLCAREAVAGVLQDADLFEDFLDLCERYDRVVLPDGPGTRQRAGLIAVAMPAG